MDERVGGGRGSRGERREGGKVALPKAEGEEIERKKEEKGKGRLGGVLRRYWEVRGEEGGGLKGMVYGNKTVNIQFSLSLSG